MRILKVQRSGINKEHTVRDLWRKWELSNIDSAFSPLVPRHGTLFVRVAAQ